MRLGSCHLWKIGNPGRSFCLPRGCGRQGARVQWRRVSCVSTTACLHNLESQSRRVTTRYRGLPTAQHTLRASSLVFWVLCSPVRHAGGGPNSTYSTGHEALAPRFAGTRVKSPARARWRWLGWSRALMSTCGELQVCCGCAPATRYTCPAAYKYKRNCYGAPVDDSDTATTLSPAPAISSSGATSFAPSRIVLTSFAGIRSTLAPKRKRQPCAVPGALPLGCQPTPPSSSPGAGRDVTSFKLAAPQPARARVRQATRVPTPAASDD